MGDIMATNSEQRPRASITTTGDFAEPGVKLWDIKDKTNPKLINFHKTGGRGGHRFDMDENYLYLSTEMGGLSRPHSGDLCLIQARKARRSLALVDSGPAHRWR